MFYMRRAVLTGDVGVVGQVWALRAAASSDAAAAAAAKPRSSAEGDPNG